jgi:hypothetical protein
MEVRLEMRKSMEHLDETILDEQYRHCQAELILHQMEHKAMKMKLELYEIEREFYRHREEKLKEMISSYK